MSPAASITDPAIQPTFTSGSVLAALHTETPVSSSTPTSLPTADATSTPALNRPLDSTATPPLLVNTATLTPTFWAKCPKDDWKLTPDFTTVLSADFPIIEGPILEFLNSGGTRKAVIDELKIDDSTYNNQHYLERDITGDNIPELVIGYGPLYVFGCNQGAYQTMLTVPTDRGNSSDVDPWIEAIRDLNADGIPEIVVTNVFAPFTWLRIYEWKDGRFQSLIKDDPANYLVDNTASLIGAEVSFTSARDGRFDLRLVGGIPVHWSLYSDGYPWRRETKIYQWDGTGFAFYRQEFAPPEFRFQAVQDGDRASLHEEYDAALVFYQDAIFNEKLDWWSRERKEYEFACFGSGSSDCQTPPVPNSDPSEKINLSGYARFRIMLLHIVRGYFPEAETVYNTLQSKHPKGQAGSVFAEMASVFWKEYQASHNIEKGCDAAIEYAKAHPVETLAYLGNSDYGIADYGDQSLTYQPEDICPFK